MVRHYAVEGKKRVEKYDREEEEVNEQPLGAVKRNKTSNGDAEDNAEKGVDVELEGIPSYQLSAIFGEQVRRTEEVEDSKEKPWKPNFAPKRRRHSCCIGQSQIFL
ncbi:hypothetical protein FNV43_RR16050 [Rhamnella rubrinervis]|uniref:Uncharacterized protein n=1 Tax=Rhamnella rubrinervis TaxID=2594499 RepID=A0A8K0GX96_9ROSA|nr:hypothetical protein FNV43_RR16050 [Rhamnella rubrinervis]